MSNLSDPSSETLCLLVGPSKNPSLVSWLWILTSPSLLLARLLLCPTPRRGHSRDDWDVPRLEYRFYGGFSQDLNHTPLSRIYDDVIGQ